MRLNYVRFSDAAGYDLSPEDLDRVGEARLNQCTPLYKQWAVQGGLFSCSLRDIFLPSAPCAFDSDVYSEQP